jgi:hypothetical protein
MNLDCKCKYSTTNNILVLLIEINILSGKESKDEFKPKLGHENQILYYSISI